MVHDGAKGLPFEGHTDGGACPDAMYSPSIEYATSDQPRAKVVVELGREQGPVWNTAIAPRTKEEGNLRGKAHTHVQSAPDVGTNTRDNAQSGLLARVAHYGVELLQSIGSVTQSEGRNNLRSYAPAVAR